jgi:hypothetical protein
MRLFDCSFTCSSSLTIEQAGITIMRYLGQIFELHIGGCKGERWGWSYSRGRKRCACPFLNTALYGYYLFSFFIGNLRSIWAMFGWIGDIYLSPKVVYKEPFVVSMLTEGNRLFLLDQLTFRLQHCFHWPPTDATPQKITQRRTKDIPTQRKFMSIRYLVFRGPSVVRSRSRPLPKERDLLRSKRKKRRLL